ncbi:MAG: hypothetical protein IPK82_37730 [Polyangiaceae bacterium]|nr:hypothetical protein [Polyangiaceae bacterium]
MIPRLKESAARVSYLRSELDRHDELKAALALDAICGRSEQADPIAREVLGALVTLMAEPGMAGRLAALRRLADEHALLPLGRLLRRPPPPRSERLEEDAPPSRVATARDGRPLTLGERRALARRPSRAALDRVLLDPHPMVVRNVLGNPRLTEDDVMRLVTRRPAVASAIAEVARHPSWSQRARLRMAILQNPGTPLDISLPLVRLLVRPELLALLRSPDVPTAVRAAAREMLERRPPVPERRDDQSH